MADVIATPTDKKPEASPNPVETKVAEPVKQKPTVPYITDNQDEILLLMFLGYAPVGTGSTEGRLSYTFAGTKELLETLKRFELQGARVFDNLNAENVFSALNNWKRALARMRAGNSALT